MEASCGAASAPSLAKCCHRPSTALKSRSRGLEQFQAAWRASDMQPMQHCSLAASCRGFLGATRQCSARLRLCLGRIILFPACKPGNQLSHACIGRVLPPDPAVLYQAYARHGAACSRQHIMPHASRRVMHAWSSAQWCTSSQRSAIPEQCAAAPPERCRLPTTSLASRLAALSLCRMHP